MSKDVIANIHAGKKGTFNYMTHMLEVLRNNGYEVKENPRNEEAIVYPESEEDE